MIALDVREIVTLFKSSQQLQFHKNSACHQPAIKSTTITSAAVFMLDVYTGLSVMNLQNKPLLYSTIFQQYTQF